MCELRLVLRANRPFSDAFLFGMHRLAKPATLYLPPNWRQEQQRRRAGRRRTNKIVTGSG